ncbi:MAG: acyltransferase, partial [Deltaproteobacteria bacterium]|nr:acyltransferase [Deltaproteobacteria bacterium]
MLHLWSLGIEEQFYIVWPLVVLFLYKHRKNWSLLLIAMFLGSFLLNIVLVYDRPAAAFYLPFTRFWELMIGCLLAFLAKLKGNYFTEAYKDMSCSRGAFSWVGATMLVVALVFSDKDAFPGWQALLPTIGVFLIIAAGPDASFNSKLLANRAMVKIGLISYPLYLWHWPLLVFARLYKDEPLTIGDRTLVILLSVIMAGLTYKFIERPIRFESKKKLIKPLCYTMLVVGVVSVLVFKTRGLIFMYPAEIREIAEFK